MESKFDAQPSGPSGSLTRLCWMCDSKLDDDEVQYCTTCELHMLWRIQADEEFRSALPLAENFGIHLDERDEEGY